MHSAGTHLLKISYRNSNDYSEFRNDSKSLAYLQIKTSAFFCATSLFEFSDGSVALCILFLKM